MTAKEFLTDLNIHLFHLFAFSRQMNEIDFAASLGGEFRGAQDAGWVTTITAHEVMDEINALTNKGQPLSKAEFRTTLLLYCQLAEAGGAYETLKNLMGIVTSTPYLLWPFKDLVQVRAVPRKIIGPNANRIFRDLARAAKGIGLSRLSSLLEEAFRDDIRNSISHADYVIWNDGLRLRNRNGGNPARLTFQEVGEEITKGTGFFQLLRAYTEDAVRSFDPPKKIVGRFSANFPMPWTISYDPQTGQFGISGSSPGPQTSASYERQTEINSHLSGKVLTIYSAVGSKKVDAFESYISVAGFEPNFISMTEDQLQSLIDDVNRLDLWDPQAQCRKQEGALLVSPWGFRWLKNPNDFDSVLEKPEDIEIVG